MTDRVPERDEQGNLVYRGARSLAFGSAVVEIGEDASWEELERDSGRRERSRRWRFELDDVRELGRFPETPLPFSYVDGRFVPEPTAPRALLCEFAL